MIQRDEINVAYILALLNQIAQDQKQPRPRNPRSTRPKKLKLVFDLLGSDVKLRSKRELIEKFMRENIPRIPSGQPVSEAFNEFWTEEKTKAIREIYETEG